MMLRSINQFCAVASLCLVASVSFSQEPAKITYDDHIKPIFREHCTSCHNTNDKKSGLSLDSYQAVMTGGSGGASVVAGDLDSSRLYALTAHNEQPFMPPNQDKIPQPKIDLLKVWIEQGMPENSGSAIKKPKASMAALSVVSVGRPEGAPPMPVSLLRQTPFYTPKAATISAMAASPWSPLVAVGGQSQVSLYHSENGQLLGVIPFPEGEPQSITFSRDGKLILIAGGRHSVEGYAALHEIATGNRIARVGDELDIALAADISEDNQLIALAGPQKMVRVYETLTGKLKYEQKKHTDWIYCVRQPIAAVGLSFGNRKRVACSLTLRGTRTRFVALLGDRIRWLWSVDPWTEPSRCGT
jgi:WD40 repeat protein